MKKIILVFIPFISIAQVGVNNNNPQAALDIITTTNQSSVIIENNNAVKKVEVDTNGNFIFNGALEINEKDPISNTVTLNPGNVGEVLVSNGPNEVPSWVNLNKSVISNYVTPVLLFRGNNLNPNTNEFNANTEYPLSFESNDGNVINTYLNPAFDVNLEPNGINTSKVNYVSVVKEGVYEVVINGLIVSNSSFIKNDENNSIIKLYVNDYLQYETGVLNQNNMQFIVKVARYLKPGDKIYTMIKSPKNWGIKEMVAFITFVDNDNN